MATLFIDLDSGNDGNTGVDKDNAWLTLDKYTTVTSLFAGDKASVRRGTSQTGAARQRDGSGAAARTIRCADDDSRSRGNSGSDRFDFTAGSACHCRREIRVDQLQVAQNQPERISPGRFGTIRKRNTGPPSIIHWGGWGCRTISARPRFFWHPGPGHG